MGSQSILKTVFLLASMVGWLIVGAAMMYLTPWVADRILGSDLTHLWMKTLNSSGYNPLWVGIGGGATLVVTVIVSLLSQGGIVDKT